MNDIITALEHYLFDGDCIKHTKYAMIGILLVLVGSQIAVTIGWAVTIPAAASHGDVLAYSYARIYAEFPANMLMYWVVGSFILLAIGVVACGVYMLFAAIWQRTKKRWMGGYDEL